MLLELLELGRHKQELKKKPLPSIVNFSKPQLNALLTLNPINPKPYRI